MCEEVHKDDRTERLLFLSTHVKRPKAYTKSQKSTYSHFLGGSTTTCIGLTDAVFLALNTLFNDSLIGVVFASTARWLPK